MTPDEVPRLLEQISYADPRVLPEDAAERRGKVAMWAGVLADVPYEFAIQAAQAHYARSPYPVLPADIAAAWRRHVRDRLDRHVDHAPAGVDPGDELAYRRAVRDGRHAVATGVDPPAPVRELTAGVGQPAAAAPMPDAVRQAVAGALPGYHRSQHAHPELAVACPWCRARPGDRCRTPAKHRRLVDSHPSRKEQYALEQQGASA